MRATVKFPLRALLNFSILLGSTKPLLNDVTCPILITQGLDDDTVRKSSARYIFDSISSDDKQLKFYKDSGHVMLWSHAADNVIRDIEAFLED
jgi:carboxylesterase